MQNTDFEALQKACKYSVIPNELGFCGPAGSSKELLSFIESPSAQKIAGTRALLQKFNALFPYLELIARANNLAPFDGRVVEAYWIGSNLLEKVSRRELQKTILSFQRFGLPREIAEKKAAMLLPGMLPHHSFHVLFVNFINPKVSPIIKNLSNCLAQWAEVKKAGAAAIKVKGIELFRESSELKLREKAKKIQNPFNLQLKPCDFVSVHWGNAIELLEEEQLQNLQRFSFKTLEAVNSL